MTTSLPPGATARPDKEAATSRGELERTPSKEGARRKRRRNPF